MFEAWEAPVLPLDDARVRRECARSRKRLLVLRVARPSLAPDAVADVSRRAILRPLAREA